MKKYWIVIHKPTMKACYGLGMKTSKWDNEEELKADMKDNCWDNSDFVPVEITEECAGK